ncbi:MAG TPA: SDR family oxidoreductase [Gemmatimonadaceae bacterium]|nr:SDR family oxidoreductase [Gemmatimonadaceae bacterium]
MELRGRVALVTGAGKRVGRALAVGLAAQGMKVAVHYHASATGAEDTARLIREAGGTPCLISADLTNGDASGALVSDVVEEHGALDVLINSSAVMERTPLGSVTAAQWDAMMALNLRAPFLLAQAAAPHLTRAHGAIVNIADLAAFETWPSYIPHGISKAGIVYMTRALARTLAPNVRVNGIAPGAVLLPDGWTEEDASKLRESTPLARLGSPDDVVGAMLFLLRADYVTGETLIVDGGRHVRK